MYPHRVPIKQSEDGSFKTYGHLKECYAFQKKMLQEPKKWLITKNVKILEKGNEHLLYIHYTQALDWAIDVEHVH